VAVSQSGETFDTLDGGPGDQAQGRQVIGAVNTWAAPSARECGSGIYLHAGRRSRSPRPRRSPRHGGFVFALLALHLGRVRDCRAADGGRLVAGLLAALPTRSPRSWPARSDRRHRPPLAACPVFYIGRVRGWPRGPRGRPEAEGGLLRPRRGLPGGRAQARPAGAGQPRHPDRGHRPRRRLWDKNISTIEEIKARGGPVIAVTDER
jgi:glucosamine--fructose-6-phosphate aminotransferase (isomerizing)